MGFIWPRKWPHYAWVVLAGIMGVLIISTGVKMSFGVLIDPLVNEHGWSRGGISLGYTLQFLAGIPAILIVGRLAQKVSGRSMVVVGTIIFVVGMLLTASVTQLWQFQFYFGSLVGGISSAPFMVLLPVLLTRWFHRKLGVAIGLMWVSLSLGPAVFSPLLTWSIATMGWNQTFVIFGLIGGAVMLVSGFFIRNNPQDKKLDPYGGLSSKPLAEDMDSTMARLSLRQVMGMSSFWILLAVHALGCLGHSVLLAHVVSIATFTGVPALAAASILSIAMVSSIISRFGMSLVAEAKGGRFTLVLALLLQTVPTLILLGATELWSFYSFAFLFGIGYGGEMVGYTIFNRQYYGTKVSLDVIYSYQLVSAMVGMAAGGWIGGALFDGTGTYFWSIVASVIAGFLGVAAALKLPSHHR